MRMNIKQSIRVHRHNAPAPLFIPVGPHCFTVIFVTAIDVSAALGVGLSKWGAALNIVGLAWIALVPEDVSQILHDVGCWLAATGGGMMLFARLFSGGQ